MEIDDIFKSIGEFGLYSKLLFALLLTLELFSALHAFAQVFLAGKSEHWCRNSAWEAQDCSEWNLTITECEDFKRAISIPLEEDDVYSSCQKYNMSGVDFTTDLLPGLNGTRDVIECDEGWVYDHSQYASSVIMDFDLVCQKAAFSSLAQSIYFVGLLVGVLFGGLLADRFGRHITFLLTTGFFAIFGIMASFSGSFWMYTLLRFGIGTANMGNSLMIFVYATEFVGPNWRVFTGVGVWFTFAGGYVVLAGLAYLIRHWQTLEMVISVPIIVCTASILLLDESPRWLISQNKYEKAEKVFNRISKVNKKTLPANYVTDNFKFERPKICNGGAAGTEGKKKRVTLIHLFMSPHLRWRAVNLIFNWFVQSMVYYGLSLSTSDLGVNIYIAFCISGLVEFPAYILSINTMRWFGRRWSCLMYMLTGGVACLLTTLIPPGFFKLTIAMIGKFGITASFSHAYILSAENFPTEVRGAAVGMCSVSARLGSVVCPYILYLGGIWEPIPLLVFGFCSILSSGLVLLLPETLNQPLPETMADAENLNKKHFTKISSDDEKMPPKKLEAL